MITMSILSVIVCFFLGAAFCQDCLPRKVQFGIVCVCNETFCDTIPTVEKLNSSQFLVYTSNKAGLRFHSSVNDFESSTSRLTVFIDSTQTKQEILGWGGAFTDATGFNLQSLPQKAQEKLLESYFSSFGLEYSLCRVPMASTDFSFRSYSYDDGEADPNLTHFRLQPEDFSYKIPFILKALNLTDNKLRLLASPWTAPKWMKTNHKYNGLGFIRKDMYQTWANYFIKFLDGYQKHGISFWAVTTANEPVMAFVPFWPLDVIAFPSWLMRDWIRENFGPTVRASNYSDLKIIILDDQRSYLPWYAITAFKDNITRNYVDGIGVHWYLDWITPAETLTLTKRLFPEKFILSTEASNLAKFSFFRRRSVDLGSWDRGEAYSRDIIQDMQNWVNGWIDWNMVLDVNGGPPNTLINAVDAPIIVNSQLGEFYKQPMFYHLGHFSKFVPPGSVVVESRTNLRNVDVVAFRRPDNGTVVVLLNRSNKQISVDVNDKNGRTAPLDLTIKSITTLVYW